MTRNRVLKESSMAAVNTPDGATAVGHGFASPAKSIGKLTIDLTPGDIIKRLQEVATKLTEAKKLTDQMQGQFASGSASWHICESIDDKLHEIAVLLGE